MTSQPDIRCLRHRDDAGKEIIDTVPDLLFGDFARGTGFLLVDQIPTKGLGPRAAASSASGLMSVA